MSRYLNIKHLIPSASDATVLRYVGAAGIISAFAVALQPQPTLVHAQTEKKKTQERKIKTFKSGESHSLCLQIRTEAPASSACFVQRPFTLTRARARSLLITCNQSINHR